MHVVVYLPTASNKITVVLLALVTFISNQANHPLTVEWLASFGQVRKLYGIFRFKYVISAFWVNCGTIKFYIWSVIWLGINLICSRANTRLRELTLAGFLLRAKEKWKFRFGAKSALAGQIPFEAHVWVSHEPVYAVVESIEKCSCITITAITVPMFELHIIILVTRCCCFAACVCLFTASFSDKIYATKTRLHGVINIYCWLA